MWRSRRRRRKKSGKIIKTILVLLIIVGAGLFYTHQSLRAAVDPDNNRPISFEIEAGTGIRAIANDLKEADLVKSADAFYLYIKLNDLGPEIQAGNFILKQSMDVEEIVTALSNAAAADQVVVTIQEGLEIRQIDAKLAEMNLIESGEFIAAANNFSNWDKWYFLDEADQSPLEFKLEGYIYPDTYFVDAEGFEPEKLIDIALNNFAEKFEPYKDQDTGYTIHEMITMASIIENEVFGSKDRRLVSDLLWRRLENQWTIGADITVIYATGNRDITYQDLQIDSPYNTRKFKGLPPGPISNPSIDAIDASYNRDKNDYWFYLTTLDTGEVIYSKTNAEHDLNKGKYLR